MCAGLDLCFVAKPQNAAAKEKPIVLETQGSFAVGGTTVTHPGTFSEEKFLSEDGQKAYGDHAYVFYQIPAHTRKYPLVFQHGGAQTKRTWESTPDGRDGFQNIFLRKHYSVYLIDQPRTGDAGLSTKAKNPGEMWGANPMYGDHTLYMLSRVGRFPNGAPELLADSKFPPGAESYDQFQRSWTIESGPRDDDMNADAMAALLNKIGPSILVTHSMGGTIGWRTPIRTDNVKAIVSFEPGGTPFIFPENEMPEPIESVYPPLSARAKGIPAADFEKLTRIPMLLIYGGNIAEQPSKEVGPDKWRTEYQMAQRFVATINRHGGDATIIYLPERGIKGNTHFLMADLNNKEIADIAEQWLHEKGLD
ncbi:alpha/beta fold hydrolase [Selenomonas sp. F0473]|uniref:alpha/beta hydrolase n=1 Tax=Selenomonas sp. F0473 TaxID=999423 RepID=UPI00029E78A7|nr:alpha/beta fold hydrolase [Selenomonas sp. F0473]EKU70609.1 hypothetical protein HMPREF9161_01655 [Selenomonas sp. F0473]